MDTLASKVKSILRKEGHISIMKLIEGGEYTSEEVLVEAIRINHSDLVDMLMDEYVELRTTPQILDKIFYLTNLTHIPKLKQTVLSYLPSALRVKYSNLRLASALKNETA